MNIREEYKLNNKGLSLVELIIAISIGVIVSGSIAALITFSIRMYQNESVNTAMQYELQSNINMMMDEIMGSSVFVVEQNPSADVTAGNVLYTKYAMFGNQSSTGFKGVIFVSRSSRVTDGTFKVYMKKVDKTGTDLKTIAADEYTAVSGTFAADPSPYLLGEYVTQFVIEPDPQHVSFDDITDPANPTYKNPIEVKVELKFEKNGWGSKKYEKHVDDITYLRNKVMNTVYVKDSTGTLREYSLKKKED